MENLKALTEAVCCVAREAGHFLKEERKSFRREVVQEKHAHDYVSYVDKASEKKVVSAPVSYTHLTLPTNSRV